MVLRSGVACAATQAAHGTLMEAAEASAAAAFIVLFLLCRFRSMSCRRQHLNYSLCTSGLGRRASFLIPRSEAEGFDNFGFQAKIIRF